MKKDNNGIYKPKKITYYIAKNENGIIVDYGSVGIGLVWTAKWEDIENFVKKEDYINSLLDSGITIEGEL
jgi:hypothetical protein